MALLHVKCQWALGSSLATSTSPTFDTVSLSPNWSTYYPQPGQDDGAPVGADVGRELPVVPASGVDVGMPTGKIT